MFVHWPDTEVSAYAVQSRISTPPRTTDRKELDSFIDTLVGERPGSRSAGTASPAGRKSRPSSTFGAGGVGAETYERGSSGSRAPTQTVSSGTQTSSVPSATDRDLPSSSTKPRITVETYHKGVQTSEPWSPQRRRGSLGVSSDSDRNVSPSQGRSPKSKRLSRREREREEELRQSLKREIEEELRAAIDLGVNGSLSSGPSKFPARDLTDEEVNAVTASNDFLDFVERSSKVIEKALDQDYDLLADYALDGVDVIDGDEDEGYEKSKGKKGRRIKQIAQFYDERDCKKRMISDVNFSPKVSIHSQTSKSHLTILVSRITPGILYQKSNCTPRSIGSSPYMEYSSTLSTRIYISKQLGYSHRQVLTIPSIANHRWLVQWASPPMGYPF